MRRSVVCLVRAVPRSRQRRLCSSCAVLVPPTGCEAAGGACAIKRLSRSPPRGRKQSADCFKSFRVEGRRGRTRKTNEGASWKSPKRAKRPELDVDVAGDDLLRILFAGGSTWTRMTGGGCSAAVILLTMPRVCHPDKGAI